MNRVTAPPTRSRSSGGINSFQLMNDSHRWWVVTMLWQGEASDNPIPQEYLEDVK
jgi:hypothetical protein